MNWLKNHKKNITIYSYEKNDKESSLSLILLLYITKILFWVRVKIKSILVIFILFYFQILR
jgi:hypothetical protein